MPLLATLRRRWLLSLALALLALTAAPVLFVAISIARMPTYDVASIALAPAYQDKGLLAEAWRLPNAARFANPLAAQSNPSFCGPASIANVARSFGRADATEKLVLAGTGKCLTGMCLMGLTLDELAEVARHGLGRRVQVLRELELTKFMELLANSANDPGKRLVINFNRGPLFRTGGGHHSPIGGYLAAQDLVFVLDVNAKFGPWLVSSDRLFTAMDTVDSSSGKKRGLLLIE